MLMTTSNERRARSSCSALPIANVRPCARGALAREPDVLLAQIDADVTLRLERAADEVRAAAAAAAHLEHVAAGERRVADRVLVEPQAVELGLARGNDAVLRIAAEPVVEHRELRNGVGGSIVVLAVLASSRTVFARS